MDRYYYGYNIKANRFVRQPPAHYTYKEPVLARAELALMLDAWRRLPKDKRPLLIDAWQDWTQHDTLATYHYGTKHLLSHSLLGRWFANNGRMIKGINNGKD